MRIQNLIKIHKLIPKILSIIKILTSIKDHNAVKNRQKITYFRYNMDLVYINAYTIFFIKILSFVLKLLRKNTFLHQSRTITLLFTHEFSSFAIPNHSSPISMSMQFEENRSKTTQVRVRKRSVDGRTDVLTDGRTLKTVRRV